MLGLFWVSLGLTANEWTVPILFGIDHLGPLSLIFIRGFSFAAICWGLITIYWFSDDIVQNVNLLCCATILTLSFTEGMLHLFPTILGREFANGILTKYSTRPDGIYYYDPLLRMNFMKPNFRTKMYYNGYTWVHQTDKFGFRNFQTVTNADVVLLGDSFIYGHGVDVKQTVGFFIEEISGYSVFNLAREGDCSLQEAYLLTWYLQQFSSPRYVLYFFYENDINDLYTYRTDKELIAFINTPLADKNLQLGLRLRKPRKADHGEDHLWARFALFKAIKQSALFNAIKQRSYLLKINDWIEFRQNVKREWLVHELHDSNDEESLGWKYTKEAIRYMNYISQIHGSQFFVVPITPNNKRHYEILKTFAHDGKVAFIETQVIDRDNASLFLPLDGHFSENGAKTMAQIVVAHLKRHP